MNTNPVLGVHHLFLKICCYEFQQPLPSSYMSEKSDGAWLPWWKVLGLLINHPGSSMYCAAPSLRPRQEAPCHLQQTKLM